MIMQQWQQPGTVTHSRISSLLISRRLTRPRDASRCTVRTSSYFKQLTSQLPVSGDNNYVCVDVPEVGVASRKSSGALRATEAEPPFLNFQIRHWIAILKQHCHYHSHSQCARTNYLYLSFFGADYLYCSFLPGITFLCVYFIILLNHLPGTCILFALPLVT